MSFIKLFEPARVGNLELRNRIVMPPMTTSYARDGFVTDTMIDYYAARAKGGVGLVIVEDCIVETPVGIHGYNDIFIDNDKFIPDLRRLAKAIKQHGAKAAIQLNHSGRMGGRLRDWRLVLTNGVQPVAPSPIAYPAKDFVVPKELTIKEIEAVEDKFASAAFRAREAGFDMVSIHCSHQFLVEQFLSPLSNKRTDAYGGSPEKRFRFIREIIEKIRQITGNDFAVICRVSGKEVMPGGLTIDDACEIAQKLEQVGVNALNVSHGANPAGVTPRTAAPLTESTVKESRGGMVPLAAAIKKSVKIPVMTVGRIIMPQMAEDILQQGRADFICIGKGLIADPDWAVKVQEGREAEIRHCIACDYCFTSVEDTSLVCAVNPACGRERAFKLVSSPKSKKVFIAGGGPAGLEAARVAAERGHKVIIYEKNQPGGQLNMALRLPGKDEYPLFLDYELVQLNRLGVKIVRQELRRDAIESEKPDVVIIAAGALPRRPALPGIEKENVLTAWQVFEGVSARGKRLSSLAGAL